MLDEIGGFDERLRIYAEEPDLCWRICLKGQRIAFAPDAIVEHDTHKTTGKFVLYGRALRQLERKFGAVLGLSRGEELRWISESYRRAHAGDGALTLGSGLACWPSAGAMPLNGWTRRLGRPPQLEALDLSERTLQPQHEIPALAVAVDGHAVTRPNHVLWWKVTDGCCVFDLARRARFGLTGVAAEAWVGLMSGLGADELYARLIDRVRGSTREAGRGHRRAPARHAGPRPADSGGRGMSSESRRAAALRLHDAVVAEKGELWLRFQGPSMTPMLHEGDLLRVRCGVPPALACGAVVAFRDRDVTIVHRFLYRRSAGVALRTKGDNRGRFDRPLRPEQVIGTVCEIRRGAQRIDLERRAWRRLSVGIAVVSMLEGLVCAGAAAVLGSVLPRRLVVRVRDAVGGCRRAATARLLRAMHPAGERPE